MEWLRSSSRLLRLPMPRRFMSTFSAVVPRLDVQMQRQRIGGEVIGRNYIVASVSVSGLVSVSVCMGP